MIKKGNHGLVPHTKKTGTILSLALLTVGLASCGDNSPSDTQSAPPAQITTPATQSQQTETDAPSAETPKILFNNPRAIGEEPDGNLLVADFSSGHIVRINHQTGELQLLSDNQNTAQGPAFSQAAGIAILPNGRIFIADLALNRVYEVDNETGLRTEFSTGDHTAIRQPFGASAGMVNGKLMIAVADTGSTEDGTVIGPVLVDPESGEVITIPRPASTTVEYNDPRSVQIVETPDAPNGESYIVMGNFADGTIIKVDPTSGERNIISRSKEPQIAEGPGFISITDIALSKDGKSIMVLDLAQEAIIDVNLETGTRKALTQSHFGSVGSGFDLLNPHGIVAVPNGYMVTDFGAPGVIFVNGEGTRTSFAVTPVNGFNQIRGIDLLANGDFAAADFGGERLIIIDRETGERTIVSGQARGSGPKLNGPVSVDELDEDTLIVSEFSSQSVLFVDKKTGDRAYLTSSAPGGRGEGPILGTRGLTIDPNNPSRLLATDFALDAVIAVDIETGNRSIHSSAISETPRGDGPPLNNPFGIDVDAGGIIYVSDMGMRAVVAIDEDGNRTIVSSNDDIGEGIKFGSPWGLRLISGEIYVGDGPGVIHVDRATGNRTLLSPGGPIFTLRELDNGQFAISHIGEINGIQIENTDGARSILSNFDNPKP